MSNKKKDDAPGVERVEGMNETEKALADLEQPAGDFKERNDLAAEHAALQNSYNLQGAVIADKDEEIATLGAQLAECRAAFDNPDRKQQRRKKEKRDALGVHDFWDGYEQALRDVAHSADGTQYVGRTGQTLSQALHDADVRRKAQLAEAEADAKAASK